MCVFFTKKLPQLRKFIQNSIIVSQFGQMINMIKK